MYLHVTMFTLPSKLILLCGFCIEPVSYMYLVSLVLIIVFFAIFCDKAERDVLVFGKQAFQFSYMAETAPLTQLSE